MATIKDVAKLAGVSVGTVSNVLNGKTNNAELISKVENAISQLGFRPDIKARSLKSAHSYLVGVLIGSLNEPGTQTVLSAIIHSLQKHGYNAMVKISDHNPVLEKRYMEDFVQQGAEAVIVDTHSAKVKWFDSDALNKLPVIFMRTKPSNLDRDINYVYLDYEKGLRDFLKWCKTTGKQHVGMILRNGMIDEGVLKQIITDSGLNVDYSLAAHNAPGNGFKKAYELYYKNSNRAGQAIDIILAGSPDLFKGIWQATDVQGYMGETKFACIKNKNWLEDSQVYECIINTSFQEIGNRVAESVLGLVDNVNRPGFVHETIKAEFSICDKKRQWPSRIQERYSNRINVASLDSETAHVLDVVSETYMRKAGLEVNFQHYRYHELWELAQNPEALKEKKIDVLLYDILWKESLAEKGILEPVCLEGQAVGGYYAGYIDNVVKECGIHQSQLYGMPILTGTQLLFYQKDLFEDTTLKRQFFQQYGYELEPPCSWETFRDIAQFYTRRYNDKSPVSYGTSMINSGNLYSSICLLNILWAINSDTFGENQKADTTMLRLGLERYKEFMEFTSDVSCESWEDVADEFKSGRVAMAILYDSYAFGLNDPMNSKVAGNVESILIPGGKPVLGGWGLGCTSTSDKILLGKEFIRWASGSECDKLFSVLSGISTRKSFYMNKDLDGLYPWKKNVLESYQQSQKRRQFRLSDGSDRSIEFYDSILGKMIGDVIKGDVSAEDAIKDFQEKINNMTKAGE